MLGGAAMCTIEHACDVQKRPGVLITFGMAYFSLKILPLDVHEATNYRYWQNTLTPPKTRRQCRQCPKPENKNNFLWRCHTIRMNDTIETVILNVSY